MIKQIISQLSYFECCMVFFPLAIFLKIKMRLLSVSIIRPSDSYHINDGAMPDWRSDKSPHKPVLWSSFWEFCQKNKELHLFKGASKLFVFVHINIILICSIYFKISYLVFLVVGLLRMHIYWHTCIYTLSHDRFNGQDIEYQFI